MGREEARKSRSLKTVIIILAILLVLSAGGLAARYLYLAHFTSNQSTATVPDNLIGDENNQTDGNMSPISSLDSAELNAAEFGVGQTESSGQTGSHNQTGSSDQTGSSSQNSNRTGADKPSAVKLELYKGQPDANQRFEVSNMFPGDVETRYFCIKAYHDKNIDLFFKADVTEQTKNLGSVLHIKVTRLETGEVLCDAPFAEVNGREFSELLKANSENATTAYYKIDVSLDTSVGNEYQAAMLKADFSWFVKDEGGLTPSPKTGDNFNLVLWVILVVTSLLLIIFLWKSRKEDERHERF